MDSSLNMIDLQYFTPNQVYSKLFHDDCVSQTGVENYLTSKEFIFYRKRILQLVKDIIRGKNEDTILVESFQEFAQNAVKHFKFIDKADMIQDTYPRETTMQNGIIYGTVLPPIHESEEQMFGNQLLYKEKVAPLTKKIDDFVVRKSEKIQQHVIPKQREFNLTQESLRSKGVDEKKSHNTKNKQFRTKKTKREKRVKNQEK